MLDSVTVLDPLSVKAALDNELQAGNPRAERKPGPTTTWRLSSPGSPPTLNLGRGSRRYELGRQCGCLVGSEVRTRHFEENTALDPKG